LGGWYDTVTGIGLILNVVLNPEGLAEVFHKIADRINERRRQTPGGGGALVEASLVPTSARAADGAAILTLDGVGVTYGGVVAVDAVSFDVRPGHIVGLIGPNGAGKTTLIDAISGFAPAGGSVHFEGNLLNGLKPHERMRRGLGRTFQGIELYEDLSVEENIRVGEEAARHGVASAGEVNVSSHLTVDGLLDLLGLTEVQHQRVRQLSQGQRQLVSVARALAGRPRIVLLDEPASGLDSNESHWLGERLRRVCDTGVTVLMIDHDMNLVLSLCDYIHVLDIGKLIASGTPDEVKTNPLVMSAYLGSTHSREATS
jgi:ABC-type branched-subunit amino acid transport system ATPase component